MDEDILRKLEERLGPLRARQRMGIERDREAQIFGKGLLSFHIENWYPVHSVIRNALKLTGLYWRGRRNTGRILLKRNDILFKELPPLFNGFTILHLSDMHVDMNEAAMQHLIELVGDVGHRAIAHSVPAERLRVNTKRAVIGTSAAGIEDHQRPQGVAIEVVWCMQKTLINFRNERQFVEIRRQTNPSTVERLAPQDFAASQSRTVYSYSRIATASSEADMASVSLGSADT